jgi:hypothetical protein
MRHSASAVAAMTGKPMLTTNSAVRRNFGRSSPTLDKAIMSAGLAHFGEDAPAWIFAGFWVCRPTQPSEDITRWRE